MRTLTRTTCSLLASLAVAAGGGIASAQQPPPPAYQGYPGYPGYGAYPSQNPQPPPQQYEDPNAQYGDPEDVTDEENSYGEGQYDDEEIDPNAYQDFQETLSPYGSWTNVDGYGEVWVPSAETVGYDFAPYASGGHWALTEYGWTWVSDYDWGWAPFHYGRWISVAGYGWGWCAGRHWGPAWVTWRAGGGYVGWAPLPPRTHVGAPPAVHVGWHAVVASEMAAGRMHFVAGAALSTVLASTRTFDSWRTTRGAAHINVGPHPSVMAAITGHAITPSPLRTVAANAIPRANFAARPLPAPAISTDRTFAPRPLPPSMTRPMPSPIPYRAAPSYAPRPMPTYRPRADARSMPTWSSPRPSWSGPRPMAYASPRYAAPTYSAPRYAAPTYSAPRYAAPTYSAPQYSAPSYAAPRASAPTYSAPSFHTSPAISAPHYSAPSHAGGGFGGGGHRR